VPIDADYAVLVVRTGSISIVVVVVVVEMGFSGRQVSAALLPY